MNISRRKFVSQTTIGLLTGSELANLRAAESETASQKSELPLAVSTWDFGKQANEAALKVLKRWIDSRCSRTGHWRH